LEKILISIIIPTYNREHLIGNTLKSLVNQTYQNWECIVVDDGSTDNTKNIIESYRNNDNRFSFYKREILPKGASHCRNIGLSKAKGQFVVFLDSDDELLEFCLENRIKKSIQFPERDFYVFPMLVEKNGAVFEEKKIPVSENYLIEFLRYKLYWGIMCTFWDIQFLKKINGFNIYYPRLNDPEIHIRAMLESTNNFKVFNNEIPDSKYIKGETKDYSSLAKKYFETLQLFITDILNYLETYNKKELKFYLKSYLIVWLRHFLKFANPKDKHTLLSFFKKKRVINSTEFYLVKLYLWLDLKKNKIASKIKSLIIKNIEPNAK